MTARYSSIANTMFVVITMFVSYGNAFAEQVNVKGTDTMKETAIKAQDAFFKDYSATEVKKYFREDYIQHNPHVPTGLEPVLGLLPALKKAGTTYKNHRL